MVLMLAIVCIFVACGLLATNISLCFTDSNSGIGCQMLTEMLGDKAATVSQFFQRSSGDGSENKEETHHKDIKEVEKPKKEAAPVGFDVENREDAEKDTTNSVEDPIAAQQLNTVSDFKFDDEDRLKSHYLVYPNHCVGEMQKQGLYEDSKWLL
mgnify:CR=1 FL=1